VTLIFLLVRFGELSITDRPITIFGYDEVEDKFIVNDYMTFEMESKDGVYILDKGDQYELLKVHKVNNQYKLQKEIVDRDPIIRINVEVANSNNDQFIVDYHTDQNYQYADEYTTDSEVIALSDIEGNFNALSSFLIANKVIDNSFDWIFGDGHLVLVGDFMDRGTNVTQCLWLIYKLEQQAKLQNGKVHFVIGNHEAMNLQGNVKYVAPKYKGFIQAYTKDKNFAEGYKEMLNDEFVLGKWLKSKNIVQKINKTLFVHGGISPEIIEMKLSLKEMNDIARKHISENLYGQTQGDQKANLVMGRKGPLWYRGMAMDYKDYYKRINIQTFNEILDFYDVEQIVIGHTIVEDVQLDFDNNLINIDVKHGKKKHSGKTKGVLITPNAIFRIDDTGERRKLKTR
jgi:hypothetical protein